jgi:alpha-tubulin suppressor-like RCC1 family protein
MKKTLIFLFCLSIFLISCDDTTSVVNCGNNQIDPGEECDGDLINSSCEENGFYEGDISCTDSCIINLSQCSGICGDDVVQTEFEEQCDPGSFVTTSCSDEGYGGGEITICLDTCKFDLSNCTGGCGDGTIQPLLGEVCEYTDLNGESCENLGYYGGDLLCNAPEDNNGCEYDISSCEQAGFCGDNITQTSFGESCDTDIPTIECETAGYHGVIGCTDSCELNCLYFIKISAGVEHSCAIDNLNRLWCWGKDDFGQLGLNSVTTESLPALVTTSSTFIDIAAGEKHTCAIDSNNKLWCWGVGYLGGIGSLISSDLPVAVEHDKSFTKVATSHSHTCVIDTGNKLWCMGENAQGQLGNDNEPVDSTVLVEVTSTKEFIDISIGISTSCAIDSTHKAWCWGLGGHGAIGVDSPDPEYHVPQLVSDSMLFNTISTHGYYTCAISTLGVPWCWGNDDYGRLGDGGGIVNSNTPVQVVTSATFVTISVNTYNACGVDTSGKGWCWGSNNGDGLLGNGTLSGIEYAPVEVSFTEPLNFISVGENHSCAINNFSAWCWGNSSWYRLGTDISLSQHTPIKIDDLQ